MEKRSSLTFAGRCSESSGWSGPLLLECWLDGWFLWESTEDLQPVERRDDLVVKIYSNLQPAWKMIHVT